MNDPLNLPKRSLLLTGTIALAMLSALTVFAVIGFSLYQANANRTDEGKLIIENVDSEDIEYIEKLLTTDTETNEIEYYSTLLDLKFTYDSNLFTIQEQNNALSFILKNSLFNEVIANIKIIDRAANDPISNRAAYYEEAYDGVKKDEEGTVEELPYAKISFVQENPLDEAAKSVINKLIVYKEIGEKYVYSEITYPRNYQINPISSSFAKLLDSAELNPEDKTVTTGTIEKENEKVSSSKLEFEKAAIIEYSSTVTIFNRSCIDIQTKDIEKWENLSSKEYKGVCVYATGNGYFISGDGKILSSTSLVAKNPIDVLLNSYWDQTSSQLFWEDYTKDLTVFLQENSIDISTAPKDEIFLSITATLVELENQGFIEFESKFSNYVQQDVSFIIDPKTQNITNSDFQLETELLTDSGNSKYLEVYNRSAGRTEGSRNNLAVIGVINSNIKSYPAIDISSDSIKKVYGSNINTFLSENNLDTQKSVVTENIELGLNQMGKQYYSLAVDSFKEAKEAYPLAGNVTEPLANISEDQIKKGSNRVISEQMLPIEDFLNKVLGVEVTSIFTVVLLTGLVVFTLCSAVIIVTSFIKNRAAVEYRPPIVGNQSITPIDSQPAAQSAKDPLVQEVQPVIGNPNTDISPAAASTPVQQPPIPPIDTPTV